MNTTAWLSIIQIAIAAAAAAAKAEGADPAILQYIADGEDAFAKALAAHNAAQTDQTAPLNPLEPIA